MHECSQFWQVVEQGLVKSSPGIDVSGCLELLYGGQPQGGENVI